MATRLEGKEVSAALRGRIGEDVGLLAGHGVVPKLAIVRVGAREDDLAYERSARKRCEALGVAVAVFALEAQATQDELLETIEAINRDDAIHGVLLFRPLPEQMDENLVRNALLPRKDVDGITDLSLAAVFSGAGEGYAPCTAQACMEMLAHFGVELRGKRVVVVGRSLVVGKPLAMMLLAKHATVTVCHTRTADLPGTCRAAEVLIAAAGQAGVVDASCAAPGQVVVDVGINVATDGSMCGDVAYDEVAAVVAAITPVPGGVGGVTSTVLAHHVVDAAKRFAGIL